MHLTVKVLREPMRGAEGRTKEGVCSTQLGALAQHPNPTLTLILTLTLALTLTLILTLTLTLTLTVS